jgi:glutamate synthase (NADPH/NADH) small chain
MACLTARRFVCNNIPDWLRLTAEGRLKEAYELSQSHKYLPRFAAGFVPPRSLQRKVTSRWLEQSGHGTVTIGAVEKYITDTAWKTVAPIVYHRTCGTTGYRCWPGGLAAADVLRRQGVQVTIYDRWRSGGGLTHGNPALS